MEGQKPLDSIDPRRGYANRLPTHSSTPQLFPEMEQLLVHYQHPGDDDVNDWSYRAHGTRSEQSLGEARMHIQQKHTLA